MCLYSVSILLALVVGLQVAIFLIFLLGATLCNSVTLLLAIKTLPLELLMTKLLLVVFILV